MAEGTSTAWVLHVCPPNGGGVDRFVRDVCARRPQDWVAHVSNSQCVLEQPSTGNMLALGWEQLQHAIGAGALGLPAAVHAHSTELNIRRMCALWGTTAARVVTLHDIGFMAERDDPPQQEQRHQFLREAHALTAPSDFIVDLLHTTPGLEGLVCHRVENGADPPTELLGHRLPVVTPTYPVAVIGAIGQHKGWSSLVAVLAALPETTPMVLLGYAEQKLTQGWLIPGKLWVHGAFQLEELPSLVRRYGVRLAFFPSGQPESFCYALSDIWLAGVQVLAPNVGALGERIRKHTGGELYDASTPAEKLAARVLAMAESEPDGPSIASAQRSIPSVYTMVKALEHIYSENSEADCTPQPQLQTLAATAARHLDSAFFRRELINLDGQTAQLTRERDAALSELQQLAKTEDERMRWQAHLERDIETLTREIRALQQNAVLAEERQLALKEELEQIQAARARMVGQIEQLLRWLPNSLVRRILQRLTR